MATVEWEMKNFGVHFLTNFAVDLDEIRLFPQPAGLLKLTLNLFWISTIQGRELCQHDFIECMIDIVLCRELVYQFISNLYDAWHNSTVWF